MIEIAANKITSNYIPIPLPVYVRTLETTREGEVSDGNIKMFFCYKAYLKSKYEELGINAPSIRIDNLPDEIILYIPLSDNINASVLAELSLYFNSKYIPIIKEYCKLNDNDLNILPL